MASKTKIRNDIIVKLARERSMVTVDGLSNELGVSPQTVRRYLNGLCEANILRRRHGGAELFEGPLNLPYDQRASTNSDEKKAIGIAAAKLVSDGDAIFLSIGTTPEMVAWALQQKKRLTVITNNLNVAMALSHEPSNRIILPGGEVRVPDRDIIGDEVLRIFESYRVEIGIFGVGGIDVDGSLLDFHSWEVRIRESIRANSKISLLVADSSKFGRTAPAIGGTIGDVDQVLIDKEPGDEFSPLMEQNAERVRFVGDSKL